mmetsp:Transcript_42001/g.83092  ORF Transcript_42001/g.83092 Transcript_42001/m.83092 type:complete len:92 (-) Transcript_42001:222-497(-)
MIWRKKLATRRVQHLHQQQQRQHILAILRSGASQTSCHFDRLDVASSSGTKTFTLASCQIKAKLLLVEIVEGLYGAEKAEELANATLTTTA